MRRTFSAVWRNPTGRIGLILVGLVAVVAVAGPLVLRFEPSQTSPDRLLGPTATHWMGTDQFGRDVLSRMVSGARVSLSVAIGGCALALIAGGFLGAVAGYLRGVVDEIIMRLMDVAFAFPFLVLAIVLAFLAGSSVPMLVIIVAFTRLPQFARLMRGGVLDVMGRDYVAAARSIWGNRPAVLWRHILPNAATPVIAYASVAIGIGVNIEAALSFLGVGVQPPAASWGAMLSDGKGYMLDAPWLTLFPGLAILLTVVSFNLLADGVRDVLDPSRATEKEAKGSKRARIRAILQPRKAS